MSKHKIKKIYTIDLFAGCGGLMDGFEQTNLYETIACVEWEKAPCINLEKRLKEKWGYSDSDKRVLRFDIQRTEELINGWSNDEEYGTGNGLDELVKKYGYVDLIIGGPPCQAYSIAGRIRDEYGMKNDYRNYLFESYLKIVKYYKPKAFIFENVPGMLSACPNGKPIVEEITAAFEEAGYVIIDDLSKAIIDFSEYGVPQNRKRIIILGVSKDHYGDKCNSIIEQFYFESLPKHKVKKKKTVKEAIGDLEPLYPSEEDYRKDGKKYSHTLSSTNIANHIPRYHNRRDIEIFKLLAEDLYFGKHKYVSTDALKKLYTEKTGKVSNVHKYYVLRLNEQSNTIPAHLYKDGLRHIHPDYKQARTITVREAARLQTFDDDYVFIGSMMEQYKMIGNAVPPLFAKILAESIYNFLI